MAEFREAFIYLAVGISTVLYILILNRLVRDHFRSYFGLLLYVCILLLTLVVDLATYKSADRSTYFLVSETVRWVGLYLAVLSFAWKALSTHPEFRWVRHWLIMLSVLTVFVALYFTYDERTSAWVQKTVNILSVAGMVLNLILWTLLVRTRSSDLTLFLVTSGLGIQAALEAAAWSMRNLANRSFYHAAYYVQILGHLLCLLVWLMAFRRARVKHVRA